MRTIIELEDKPRDLVGRILALNPAVCQKYACGGFQLGPNCPYAVVTSRAVQAKLHDALLRGQLVDITDQNVGEGLKLKHGSTSAAKILDDDPGKKVFLAMSQDGSLLVVAPETEEQAAELERKILEQGYIAPNGPVEVRDDFVTKDGAVSGRCPRDAAESILNNLANALDKARSGFDKPTPIKTI